MSELRLGAHVSISDGFGEAVEEQADLGGNCGQLFVGSPRGWNVSDVDDEDAETFRDASATHDIGPWIVHGTYLINLATPKDDLADNSLTTIQGELDACARLGIPYYVFHPGSHTGAGVEAGIENIATRLSTLDVPSSTMVLLENTAGAGTSLGRTFEQLGAMIAGTELADDEVGVCLDTCHLFAAGYEFGSPDQTQSLLAEFDSAVGQASLKYLHLNDSKHPHGSEKDEHEHIGEGEIGEEWFTHLLAAPELRDLPMVLETPVDDKGYAWNIDKIRSISEG